MKSMDFTLRIGQPPIGKRRKVGRPTREAKLNNTLTINGENHHGFTGAGIVEGFTADGLDYAKGEDGDAIRFKNILET